MRVEARLNRLEAAMKKVQLELQLVTGDSILLDDSDLLSLFNEAMKLVPVVDADGKTYYPRAEESLSDNMLSVMYAADGQDEFIDMIRGIVKNYKEATE